MLSNCGAGEDSWESLGQQGDLPNVPGDGEYKLVVATRGGLGGEFGVAIAKKSVKVEILY